MAKKRVVSLLLILCLACSTFAALAEAETTPSYELDLEGPTWDHPTITMLVLPLYDQTWWNPSYLNASLRAINQWNDAFTYFASNYSAFSYLSGIKLEPTVSNFSSPGYDVYVSWVEQFGNETCDAGLTQTQYDSAGVVTGASTNCSAYDCYGNILNEVDMQNVLLHELGHVVGLGHSNSSDDTMFYAYTLGSPVRELSTLDTFGVATVFRWMANSPIYTADNQGPPISSVTLPSSIDYRFIPISAENAPPESTINQLVTFLGAFAEFVLQPVVLTLIILAIAAIAAYSTITRSHRRRMQDEKNMPRGT